MFDRTRTRACRVRRGAVCVGAVPTTIVATPQVGHAVQINDDISGALIMTGDNSSFAVTSNQDTGLEAAEPAPTCQSNFGSTVWFEWVPSEPGTATFSTGPTGGSSDFDSIIDVFTSPVASPGVHEITSVGCDDDGGDFLWSSVDVDVTQGMTYWVRVSGFAAQQGTFSLTWSLDSACVSGTMFVDDTATGTDSGEDWTNAIPSLSDALDLRSVCGGPDLIKVAEGTYTTTGGSSPFVLNDVKLRGGFVPGETTGYAADPYGHPTILTADVNGNDTADNTVNRLDNANYVAQIDSGDTRIDGVTMHGGGLSNVVHNGDILILTRSTLSGAYPGRAASLFDLTYFVNVEVRDNTSGSFIDPGVVRVTDEAFFFHTLVADNDDFGNSLDVVRVSADGDLWLQSSTIAGNTTGTASTTAAIDVAAGGELTVENSIVWGNEVGVSIEAGAGSTVAVSDSTIEGDPTSLNIDPAFESPATGDYRLQGTSPVRDIGDTADALALTDTYDLDVDGNTSEPLPDLDLNERIVNSEVDLGAYEQQTLPDADNDDVLDGVDNCPNDPNPGQADADNDGIGDACDVDADNDDVDDAIDNCPDTPNADQADIDDDGLGDACDPTDDSEAFVTTDPARFADTRPLGETFDGAFERAGANPAGTSYEVQIGGRGDVPESATAAIINLTTILADGPGHATVYPCTAKVPNSSAVNYLPGGVDPNEVIAKLSPDGRICIYTHASAHLLVDVVGYAGATSQYIPIDPARYADSRPQPTFDNAYRDNGHVTGGTFWKIPIAGRGPIPAGASTAVLNITAVAPWGPGHITVFPCTAKVPTASSLNYTAGMVRPNEVVAKLSDTGHVCVYTHATTHLIVDAVGYLEPTTAYAAIDPTRYADSRPQDTFDGLFSDTGPNAAGASWEIDIAGRGDVPADATTAVLNVTVVLPDAFGHATVYPCTASVPNASSLNYNPGDVRANELIAKLSPTGTVCIYTHANAHLIVDVVGHDGTSPI